MLLQRRLQGLQEVVDVSEDLKRHWRSIVAERMGSLHELCWQPTELRRKTLAKLSVLSEQAGDLLSIATPKSARARRAAACTVATVAHELSKAQTFLTEVGVPGAPSVTIVWQTSFGVPFAIGVLTFAVGDLADRTGVWKR